MSLPRDIADIGEAAGILDRLSIAPVARMLRDIAAAAAATGTGPISSGEQMRWTPVVAHAADYARTVLAAAPKIFPTVPDTAEEIQDIDAIIAAAEPNIDGLIADLEDTIARAAQRRAE